MVLGYCFGIFYKKDADLNLRKKFLNYVGFGAIILFFVLRYSNVYGDLHSWTTQETIEKTIISFFNVHKYPPSLSFLLITLGPALLFLNNLEHNRLHVHQFYL